MVPSRAPRPGLTGVAIVAALAVLVTLASESVFQGIHALDVMVIEQTRWLESRLADLAFCIVTHAGSRPALFLVICVVGAWARTRGHRRAFWILLASGVTAVATNMALKAIVARERPTLIVEHPAGRTPSFPSGHAMESLVVYGAVVAVVLHIRPPARRAAIPAAALLIAAIGFSRVYLGHHWPSDVVGGFAAAVPLLVATLHWLHHGLEDWRIRASSSP